MDEEGLDMKVTNKLAIKWRTETIPADRNMNTNIVSNHALNYGVPVFMWNNLVYRPHTCNYYVLH